MQVEQSIIIIKALADKSRLFILNALLEKPHYVEEISNRLELAASTVSFHLKKLESANLVEKEKDQYYINYKINKEIFSTSLKDIISFKNVEEHAQKDRIASYKVKVIETFFKNGKLIQIPKQHKKRWIVLEKFVALFSKDITYTEKEVDMEILKFYDDYCTIRRYLVDENILCRKNGEYWLNQQPKHVGEF